ncbi:hypothetical protein [Maricaulis parjimensis]|uniref:hypothetical protein n=1 Tax=Maricaulis parjimensis TaxID=144023 RepID=UPI00193A2E0E|nr:hypothetical protein [Maricaulis parjimensis]
MSAVLIAALAGLTLVQSEPAAGAPPSNASRLQDMLNAMRDDTPEHEAEREARLQADARAYIAEVEAALQALRGYAPAMRTGDEADTLAVLDQFDAWAELYAVGDTHALTADQQARRAEFLRQAAWAQARLLPRLRSGLGAIDVLRPRTHCSAQSGPSGVILCTNPAFQRESEVRDFRYQTRDLFRRLRARRVLYKPFASQATNYRSDSYEPPRDNQMVIWDRNGGFRDVSD